MRSFILSSWLRSLACLTVVATVSVCTISPAKAADPIDPAVGDQIHVMDGRSLNDVIAQSLWGAGGTCPTKVYADYDYQYNQALSYGFDNKEAANVLVRWWNIPQDSPAYGAPQTLSELGRKINYTINPLTATGQYSWEKNDYKESSDAEYFNLSDLVNDSSSTQTLPVPSWTRSVTESTTSTTETTWTAGASATASFNIPIVGQTKITLSVTYSHQSGTSTTTSETKTIQVPSSSIVVPPKTKEAVRIVLSSTNVQGTIRGGIPLEGVVPDSGLVTARANLYIGGKHEAHLWDRQGGWARVSQNRMDLKDIFNCYNSNNAVQMDPSTGKYYLTAKLGVNAKTAYSYSIQVKESPAENNYSGPTNGAQNDQWRTIHQGTV